jgi:hypothetical protein
MDQADGVLNPQADRVSEPHACPAINASPRNNVRGLEPPAERRAREQRDNPLPNRPTAINMSPFRQNATATLFRHEQGELLIAAVAALDGGSLRDLAIVRSSVAGG